MLSLLILLAAFLKFLGAEDAGGVQEEVANTTLQTLRSELKRGKGEVPTLLGNLAEKGSKMVQLKLGGGFKDV